MNTRMGRTGPGEFDLDPYTTAPLRLEMILEFRGRTPGEVFDVMGDPSRITDWYLLAEKVEMRRTANDASGDEFDVTFVFFGRVHEEVLHWDPPHRYVYRASGPEFPIKDYVAMIEVSESGEGLGTMRWTQYFDVIEGRHFQRVLPLILPPINEESLKLLSPLVGGVRSEVRSHF